MIFDGWVADTAVYRLASNREKRSNYIGESTR